VIGVEVADRGEVAGGLLAGAAVGEREVVGDQGQGIAGAELDAEEQRRAVARIEGEGGRGVGAGAGVVAELAGGAGGAVVQVDADGRRQRLLLLVEEGLDAGAGRGPVALLEVRQAKPGEGGCRPS
jgi:hypothetical protein